MKDINLNEKTSAHPIEIIDQILKNQLKTSKNENKAQNILDCFNWLENQRPSVFEK